MSTPSKRPKAAALFPPLTDNKLSTPTKTVSPVKKVQGDEKVESINNGNDEDEDIPHETIVIPRQPIISHLDGRESNPSPKKVLAVSRKSPSYASVCETPSKKIVSVAETPMTTTGMSDVSSSPSGYLTEERQPSRRRVQSFPALRKNQLPLMVEEETTQWQRRNLRAAFLNHDVYGWKPSPMVSKKLKLAESWEKALIKSFGDPWDELLKTRSKSSWKRRFLFQLRCASNLQIVPNVLKGFCFILQLYYKYPLYCLIMLCMMNERQLLYQQYFKKQNTKNSFRNLLNRPLSRRQTMNECQTHPAFLHQSRAWNTTKPGMTKAS